MLLCAYLEKCSHICKDIIMLLHRILPKSIKQELSSLTLIFSFLGTSGNFLLKIINSLQIMRLN